MMAPAARPFFLLASTASPFPTFAAFRFLVLSDSFQSSKSSFLSSGVNAFSTSRCLPSFAILIICS